MWLRRGLVVLLSVACCLSAPRAWAEERVAPDGSASELEELAAQAAQLHTAGRYAEALGPARQLLRLTEQRAGPDHPLVSQSLNNLALVLQKAGQPGEARPLLVRALQIDE